MIVPHCTSVTWMDGVLNGLRTIGNGLRTIGNYVLFYSSAKVDQKKRSDVEPAATKPRDVGVGERSNMHHEKNM